MERLFEKMLKAVFILKLIVLGLIVLSGFVLGRLVRKRAALMSEDPYMPVGENADTILALRYL